MEQSYMTQKATRNSNLSAILTAAIAVLLLALLVTVSIKPLYNHFAGPFEVSAEALFSYQGPDGTLRTYVTIHPNVALDTNFYYYEKQEDGSEKVIHSYYALLFDDRLLLAKYPGSGKGDIFTPEPITGNIVNLTDAENAEVLQSLKADYPNLKDAFLPYLLDTTVKSSPVWLLIAGIAILTGFAIWSVVNLVRCSRVSSSLPIVHDLPSDGENLLVKNGQVPAEMGDLIENDHPNPVPGLQQEQTTDPSDLSERR